MPIITSNPLILIDFGGVQVFDTATVDTNILIAEKAIYQGVTNACVLDKNFSINNTSDYFEQRFSKTKYTNQSWTVLTIDEQRIKEKIESLGTPLKSWDIQINYGIKTGYNEAFIISSDMRRELIDKSSEADSIIRPVLRGRDIQKYKANWENLWLIYVPWHFPLHLDNSIQGVSIEAEENFETQYPAIYDFLCTHKKKLSERNKAETGIRYEWYALQRWGANYWEEFEKTKIIYPNMTKYLPFIYDTNGYYINDKAFMITGNNLEYLTAFFNSSLFKYCFTENFPELMGGTRELRKIFFDKIPVKKVDNETNNLFKEKIENLQKLKSVNQETKLLEEEIDNLIFDHYNLTFSERQIIGFI